VLTTTKTMNSKCRLDYLTPNVERQVAFGGRSQKLNAGVCSVSDDHDDDDDDDMWNLLIDMLCSNELGNFSCSFWGLPFWQFLS